MVIGVQSSGFDRLNPWFRGLVLHNIPFAVRPSCEISFGIPVTGKNNKIQLFPSNIKRRLVTKIQTRTLYSSLLEYAYRV